MADLLEHGSRDGASFLAEASRLLANSLDYETTLSTVAGLALPDLGGWCIVDIVEDNGDIRRLAIVHPDLDKQELARELREGWPPDRDDPMGVPAVARSLAPEVISHLDEDVLLRTARSRRNLDILRRLGVGSLLTVPLAARGDVLGAITFVGAGDDHRYDQDDLELATDLANRAAIAIDNARLYRQARRAREAAELASRAKSQFLGVMSHELRTPINAILGYTQLLDMGVKGSLADDQRALLARVESSSQHLLELVTRLLDVSKAEAGELSVSNEAVDAAGVIESALQIASAKAPDEIRVETRCAPDGPLTFLGDGIRVRQILVHLLSNAFRFTRGAGTVAVQCARVDESPAGLSRDGGPWLRIDIRDEGVGIPDERIEAIFEPFVQGDRSVFTRETDGSGLGLAIGRYLARFMGGDLTVASVADVGSTFSLWLPAPRSQPDDDYDRRLFDRDTAGLTALSDHIYRRMQPILDAHTARLRSDGTVPRAREASELQLRNHLPYFLTGIASLLAHADRLDDITQVLRGDNAIQRTVLELHGAQRHQLGWSEDALSRDLDLLRRTIRHDVRTTGVDRIDSDEPLQVLDRLFEQAYSISRQGWRHAESNPIRAEAASPRPQAFPYSA